MDFHKKAKEVDKVFELFFRLWVSGSHEQGKKLLAAHGERCYRAGVKRVIELLDKMLEELRPEAKVNWPKAKVLSDAISAARLLAPKEGKKET